jgi:hypothetical protein
MALADVPEARDALAFGDLGQCALRGVLRTLE